MNNHTNKLIGKYIATSTKRKFIEIKRNQLLILDALLYDGGVKKKYEDKQKKMRFTEHSGNFGVENSTIDRIIVSAKTTREDSDDEEILLPHNLSDTYEYKYYFHTHPATPKIGSRAKDGIIYDFPSISDIFHFIDHYNMGKTVGSIVVTPEGYYTIYSPNNKKKITYDEEIEDSIFSQMTTEFEILQNEACNEYGTDFDEDFFYKVISSDTKYIKKYNKILENYLNKQVKIKYKNRKYDSLSGLWIIKKLHLPV